MKKILIAVLIAFSVPAFARDFTIEDYKVFMDLRPNGILEVDEQITVNFEVDRQGIFRNIPTSAEMEGKKRKIRIFQIKANDRMKVQRNKGELIIRLGTPGVYRSGKGTYDIQYKVDYVLLTGNQEYDELYWNIIGTGWPAPIANSRLVLTLPETVRLGENMDYRVFAGYGGSTSDAGVFHNESGNQIIVSYPQVLEPGEGLTIQLKLKKGIIKIPGWKKAWYAFISFINRFAHFIGIALVLLFAFMIWRKYGKDRKIPIMVEFLPPPDITPSDASSVLKQRPSLDISATLVDLARRGYIIIGKDEKDVYIERGAKREGDLRGFEKELVDRLFEASYTEKDNTERVYTYSLEDTFYADYNIVQAKFYGEFESKDFFETAGNAWRVAFIVLPILLLILLFVGILYLRWGYKMVVFSIFSAIIMFVFSFIMPRKTNKGVETHAKILGFKEFMMRAEKEKIQRLMEEIPTYFDDTVAYAIVFGLAKKWGKLFDGLLKEPPHWYHDRTYTGVFWVSSFARDLGHHMSDISSAAVSQPAPSGGGGGGSDGYSGGGFGGGFGGSVGGGFGGGGGGSW